MIPSRRLALAALSLVACGEVAPVSLSEDAGVSLWIDAQDAQVDAQVDVQTPRCVPVLLDVTHCRPPSGD
jgi:hypothetical protein